MSVISVSPPFPVFFDSEGESLEAGQIYIGTVNTNPLILANQIATYSDEALAIPVAQPIRTNGGYPVNGSGSPIRIYVGAADYSIVILDHNGSLVFSSPSNKTKLGLIDLSTDVTGLLPSTSIKYVITPAETSAGVTPTNYFYQPGNVLRYGADPTGATDSSAAVASAVASNKYIWFPAVTALTTTAYKYNLTIQDLDDKNLFSPSFGVRHIPTSSATPVIDVYGSPAAGCTNIWLSGSWLFDSSLSGTPTNAGIGLRYRAANPGFLWKSGWDRVYHKGFQDGVVTDCDVSIGEIFSCSFGPTDAVSCSRYSVKHRGIYNTYDRIFCGSTGDYALYSDVSRSQWNEIVTDGPVGFSANGSGNVIDTITIEAINGAGSAVALELGGTGTTLHRAALLEVPTAKCPIGVAVGGSATACVIGDLSISGTSYPATPIQLQNGSGGVLGSAAIPGGTKISNSTTVAAAWRFLGNVSTAYIGERYLDPNLLVDYGGRLKQVIGGVTRKRLALTYSATIATDSLVASRFTITVTNSTAFTISNPTNAEDGCEITYTIRNASGGAMGVITWGALFKMSTWTNPASATSRSITFMYDGTNWVQVGQTGADVAN